jgi:hypothetical protein
MNNLYQIFYPYNKFDSVEDVENRFSKFMYDKQYIDFEVDEIVEPVVEPVIEPVVEPIVSAKVVSSKLLIPDKIDSLFWCIYISHYGYEEYLAIGNKYMNAEFVEKAKIMEYLKSSRSILKTINKKITLGAAQEVMSELLTNKKTSLLAINACAAYYKTNILIENTMNGTYIEYIYDTDGKWIHLKYLSKARYGICEIRPITKTGIKIEYPDKPLRGISTYKVGELNELAASIPAVANDPQRSTWNKNDLYGKIWNLLLWA